jgi:hypothetical protein
MKNLLLVFLGSFFLTISSQLHAQSWSAVGAGNTGGVLSLAVNNGELYSSNPGPVMKWNGSSWSSTGTGPGYSPLIPFNGNLYGGGNGMVAVWNGTTWSGTGTGLSDYIEVMGVNNNVLYAAGNFVSWSGTSDILISQLASWNGSSWTSMSGVNNKTYMRAIASYNGELYLGADFPHDSIGGIQAHGVARWNGTNWSAAGTGVGMTGSAIFSFCVFNGELYAGGQFSSIGNISANSIAKWNGTSWSALGSGITGTLNGNVGTVNAIAGYNGELYAAGSFTNAGGTAIRNIAKWNGTSWSALGTGIGDNGVNALCVFGNELYVGGSFDSAGTVPANNIAKWSQSCYATIAANGSTVICAGGSVRLDAISSTGLTYQWKLNNVNISGATASNYFVSAAGNYSCNVTTTCGLISTNTITIAVANAAPSASITANGPTTFCQNTVVTLNANTGQGLTYQWQLNSVNISGRTDASLPVASSGNYRCVVSNSCGSTTSNTITTTVTSNPTATINAGGPTTFCTGGAVVLSANTGTGLNYQWQKNLVNITGATTSSYVATTQGSYTCIVSNNCGTATSNSKSIIVNTVPVQPAAISGPSSVCHNQNNVTYSISSLPSATSYTWTVPAGAQLKSGQGTTTIKVRFGNSAGSITVKANNSCGAGAVRSLSVTMPCREMEDVSGDAMIVNVYPNPSQENFSFRMENAVSDFYSVNIVDLTGRVVETHEKIPANTIFNCGENLKEGIYVAELITGNDRIVLKLVKQQ